MFHYHNEIVKAAWLIKKCFSSSFWRFTVQGWVGPTGLASDEGSRWQMAVAEQRKDQDVSQGAQSTGPISQDTPPGPKDRLLGLPPRHCDWIVSTLPLPLTFHFGH